MKKIALTLAAAAFIFVANAQTAPAAKTAETKKEAAPAKKDEKATAKHTAKHADHNVKKEEKPAAKPADKK